MLPEGEWGSFLSTVGDDAVEFGRRVQDDLPVAAYAEYDSMAGGSPLKFTDPGEVRALFNGLAAANAEAPATMPSTDDYTQFWFEFSDGTTFGFHFSSMIYEKHTDSGYVDFTLTPNDNWVWFALAAQDYTYGKSRR